MQVTLNLDDSLLNEALQLTNLTNQEELVNLALQELVRSRSDSSRASPRKKNLLDLAGQIQLTKDFDPIILDRATESHQS
ncbi:MAG: type II toxin-antitoxin system VapB family antitoxin [Coleofasciculaceae cyanobacterium]